MKSEGHIDQFERSRARLKGLAYRMLGSLTDADDVLQETWIRWQAVDLRKVENGEAFLRTILTRLCLDELKSAKRRREQYIGPWLPEPVTDEQLGIDGHAHLAEDMTIAFLLALERLSPAERAVLLLHDVFATPFDEIAGMLSKSPAACRQIAVRARKRIQSARSPARANRVHAQRLADAFITAMRNGDMKAIEAVLCEDVEVHTDGGGVRPAAINVISGREKAARLFLGLRRKASSAYPHVLSKGMFNGSPGFVSLDSEGEPQVTVLEVAAAGGISGIYVVRNPEKLAALNVPELSDQSDLRAM